MSLATQLKMNWMKKVNLFSSSFDNGPRGSMYKPHKEEVSMFSGERFVEPYQ